MYSRATSCTVLNIHLVYCRRVYSRATSCTVLNIHLVYCRRVYSRATSPRLGVLAPELDQAGQLYLAYVDLPFVEDQRSLQFQSLVDPRRPQGRLQDEVIDDLIDEMNLEVESADEVRKL